MSAVLDYNFQEENKSEHFNRLRSLLRGVIRHDKQVIIEHLPY